MSRSARARWALLSPAAALLVACSLDSHGTGSPDGGAGASGTATSTSESSTGAGGAAPYCGDGHIDSAEECDDGNDVPDDGCTGCVVDCGCPGGCVDAIEWKDAESHHCYRLELGAAAAWLDAEAACKQWGGELAALTPVAELGLVAPRLPADAALLLWTGGNDREKEGTFAWSDGEPWTYAPKLPPWLGAQPDDLGMGEDCVSISRNMEAPSGAGINDSGCALSLPYLCERSPAQR